MANNKVVLKFLADTKSISKATAEINQKLGVIGKAAKFAGVAVAAAFAAKPVVDFAQESIAAASDLEESLNKVTAVFQGNAAVVENWSKSSVTQFGLSQGAALEAAGTFGNLFTSFGVGIDEAEKFSTSLVELAADLASFNNTSIDQAITALRSGLSGETEPLKRFGLALNQAAIETEALSLGLISNKSELDAAAKSQAIYSLIIKGTTNAQGDFLRTSDGLANTQRILQAAVEDAKAEIGVGLLNAVESVTQAFGGANGMAATIEDTGQTVGDFTRGIGLLVDEIVTLQDTTNDVLSPFRSLGDLAFGLANRLSGGLLEGVTTTTRAITLSGEAQRLWEQSIKDADRASQIAARRLRGTMIPAALEAAQAANVLEGEAREAASAILDMVAAQDNRSVRQMDSFGREIDKQSIYWKNAKDENAQYWDSLQTGVSSSTGSLKRAEEEGIKVRSILRDIAKETDIAIIGIKNVTGKVGEDVNAAIQEQLSVTQGLIEQQKEIIKQGQAEIEAISKSIVSNVLGNLGFQTTDSEGNALTPEQIVKIFLGDTEKQKQAVESIANNIGTALPPALLNMVLGLKPDTAVALADYLGNNPDQLNALRDNYNALATYTETELGIPMGEAWATIGDESAVSMIENAKARIKEEKEAFRKFVRSQLKTKITIDVEYREINRPSSVISAINSYENNNGTTWRVS